MAYKHQYITISREDHEYRLALREIKREIRKEEAREYRANKRIERSSAKSQSLK